MVKTFKVYHVICEGSSEVAYLQELARHIRNTGFELTLKPYNLGGVSSYKGIKRKCFEAVKNKKKNDEIFIWLDNDIFKRKELSKSELQRILGNFSSIKYNYENFEDFLVMHLPEGQVYNWHKICRKENHFEIPMTAKKVKEPIQSIFPNYSKGFLPKVIKINNESLDRLFENQKKTSIKFKSDFVDVIRQLLKISN